MVHHDPMTEHVMSDRPRTKSQRQDDALAEIATEDAAVARPCIDEARQFLDSPRAVFVRTVEVAENEHEGMACAADIDAAVKPDRYDKGGVRVGDRIPRVEPGETATMKLARANGYDENRADPNHWLHRGETVLDEAERIVGGARAESYGKAERNLGRIAAMWAAYLDHPVTARDVAQMMVLLKVARDAHRAKRDNLVDQAGYTLLADMIADTATQDPAADL